MNRLFSAGATSVLAAMLISSTAHADDQRPLIWKPSKDSDTSYSVKLGLRLPTQLESEAGISMGLNTTESGAPIDTPVRFWSNFVAEKMKTPASEATRGVGVSIDGVSGSAAISMNYYEKEIATSTIDLEKRSHYVMRYNGTTGEWTGLDASQSVRVSVQPTGTTFVGRVSGTEDFSTVGAGIGLEQKLGEYLTISGSLDRNSDAAKPAASINAHYSFTW